MSSRLTRRRVLAATGATAMTAAATGAHAAGDRAEAESRKAPFGYCLNTGTIRGQKAGIVKELEAAAKAGYGALEPWVRSLRQYTGSGGSLKDLGKRVADLGLKIPSAIAFCSWLSDDKDRRAKALEQAKEDMGMLRAIGGTGIAAPPAGMRGPVDLQAAAERYRALLELGRNMDIVPQLEIWGPSKALSRIGQAAYVTAEAGHPDACCLLDAYHIYKGGSRFEGLGVLHGGQMRVFHLNDYPADPPRETIRDGDRVMPGDGVAPMKTILGALARTGFRGWLSLELFNRTYWQKPVDEVAKIGLAKMKACVAKAMV